MPAVPYDPGIGRIWSLRPRPGVWPAAFRLLCTFAPVIVVGRREAIDIVRFEVSRLERRNFVDKVYAAVSPEDARKADAMDRCGVELLNTQEDDSSDVFLARKTVWYPNNPGRIPVNTPSVRFIDFINQLFGDSPNTNSKGITVDFCSTTSYPLSSSNSRAVRLVKNRR